MNYLIIDGGTTNLRVTLADEHARILSQSKRSIGAAATALAGSTAPLRDAVRDCIRELLDAHGLSYEDVNGCVAYGMITCASGLMEVPHLVAPAGLTDFRQGMVSQHFEDIAPFPIHFIPGMKNFSGQVTLDNLAAMDMMRGEETEAIGFAELAQPDTPCVLMLPGSHNKLIALAADGRLAGCMTTISGELLSVLTRHTILSESVGGQLLQPEHYDRELLLSGARACESGLGRAAFSTRILRTLGQFPQERAASFLLGVVLRTDLDALEAFEPAQDAPLYIAGKEPLQQALVDLLTAHGRSASALDAATAGKVGLVGAMKIAGWL